MLYNKTTMKMGGTIKVGCGARGGSEYAFEFSRNSLQRYSDKLLNECRNYENHEKNKRGGFANNARHERMCRTIAMLLRSRAEKISLENICASINVSHSSMLAYLRQIKYRVNGRGRY